MKPITFAALLLGALTISASAQDLQDEPGPGVARLSLVDGDVTVRRGDSGEFVAGERNAPLVALDHVLTGNDGRAEIQFDWANMLRLAPNSESRMAALEEGDFFLQVVEGLATFTVLRESTALVEISTLTASIRPVEQGTYRILVRPDGSTQITVRSGEAEIFTTRGSEFLRAGRTMEVRGDPVNPDIVVLASVPLDEWDAWNDARNRDLNRSESYRYVSRDIYGADELDGHGRWVYDSPYGWVWVPNVSRSWAPYRVGRWSWVNYYGWTWISGDPWGWAPYHYGRWYSSPIYGWVWYPGAFTARHVWRPALVTFFGWGSGGFRVNVGIGFGYRNVGWVALAPYEVYRPWYGRGNRNNIRINNTVVNNTVINNTVVNNVDITRYRNARVVNGRHGITSVNTEDFGLHRVNTNNFVRASERELTRAGEVRGRVPLDPTPESRRFSDRAVDARTITQRDIDDSQLVRRGGGNPLGNRSAAAARANAAQADANGGQAANSPSSNNARATANRGQGNATANTQQQRATTGAVTAAEPAVSNPRGGNPLGNRSATAARANTPAPRRTQPEGRVQPQGNSSNADNARATANRGQGNATANAQQQRATTGAVTAAEPAVSNPRGGNPLGNRSATAARANTPAPRRTQPEGRVQPQGNSSNANNGQASTDRGQQQRARSGATGNAPTQATAPTTQRRTVPRPQANSSAGVTASPSGSSNNRSQARQRDSQAAPAPQAQRAPQTRSAPSARPESQAQRAPQTRSAPSARPEPQAQRAPETRSAPSARPAPQPQRTPQARSAPRNNGGGGARTAPAPRTNGGGNSGGNSDQSEAGIPGRGRRP